jgi:threonine/homoserine/homoserine lactone efflux protein
MLVSATNPKTLFFYAAFFPQFIDPASPPGPQLGLLGATFLVIATVLDGAYAILAGRLRPWLRSRDRARLRNRLAGSCLIAAALGLALARRQ